MHTARRGLQLSRSALNVVQLKEAVFTRSVPFLTDSMSVASSCFGSGNQARLGTAGLRASKHRGVQHAE